MRSAFFQPGDSRPAEEQAGPAGLFGVGVQISHNIQAVATAMVEMNAAANEIARNASHASRVAQEAVRSVESANTTVASLSESSAEVGMVVKVVGTVAGETKLLALNATIEAARAGESGRGFAVVAGAIKELATETARAAEDISHKIDAMEHNSRVTAEGLAQIEGVINQVHEMQQAIGCAVEEQTVTTAEIARNSGEVARGGTEISRAMAEVAQAIQGTAESAEQTR